MPGRKNFVQVDIWSSLLYFSPHCCWLSSWRSYKHGINLVSLLRLLVALSSFFFCLIHYFFFNSSTQGPTYRLSGFWHVQICFDTTKDHYMADSLCCGLNIFATCEFLVKLLTQSRIEPLLYWCDIGGEFLVLLCFSCSICRGQLIVLIGLFVALISLEAFSSRFLMQILFQWGQNLSLLYDRVLRYPDRVMNLYFTYLFVLRAVTKVSVKLLSPSLSAEFCLRCINKASPVV